MQVFFFTIGKILYTVACKMPFTEIIVVLYTLLQEARFYLTFLN